MILSQETVEKIISLKAKYPISRSALIPALHMAQKEIGYLPLEIQAEVANLFEIDLNEVHSVVTFYDMFYEKPQGKHLLHVCKNVSCMLAGGDKILNRLCHMLDVAPHETTADGEFTIIPSECLGACDLAPMMICGEKVIGPLKEDDLEEILEKTRACIDDTQEVTNG